MTSLERFVQAQGGIYPHALSELCKGLKTSHWMWFVFPQIAGLGRSPTARRFAIRDLAEAHAYLGHDVLGPRLGEATAAVITWGGRRTLSEIFGTVDAVKFVSCMTLFEAASGDRGQASFTHALDVLAEGARDRQTLALIAT